MARRGTGTITTESRIGLVGYRAQLERARRMCARLYVEPDWAEDRSVCFQDDMLNAFQAIWHVKDWIRNDPILSAQEHDEVRSAVVDAAEASPVLRICADICNGSKHFKLNRPKSGTEEGARLEHLRHSRISGFTTDVDCLIDTGIRGESGDRTLESGKQLVKDGIAEWERILREHKLPIDGRT